MKKLLSLMLLSSMILGITACSSGEVSSDNESEKTDQKEEQKEEKKEEQKIYGIDDSIVYSEDGKDLYSFKINSVKITDERNQFSEKEVAQVVVIEYTYENLGDDDDVFISSFEFTVMDAEGNVCETYPAGVNKYAQPTPMGAKCTAEEAYGLVSESSTIKLRFQEPFSDAQAIFELPIE